MFGYTVWWVSVSLIWFLIVSQCLIGNRCLCRHATLFLTSGKERCVKTQRTASTTHNPAYKLTYVEVKRLNLIQPDVRRWEGEIIYLDLYVISKNYRPTSCSSFPGRRLKNAMLSGIGSLMADRAYAAFPLSFRFLFCFRPPQNSKHYWLVNMTYKVLKSHCLVSNVIWTCFYCSFISTCWKRDQSQYSN